MLTPIEIENQQFKKTFLGYNASEVNDFLERVFENYEKIYKENIAAKEKISVLSDAVKQYKTIEETLQNTLVVAQSAGDEVKRNAYEKAENIIKEAETKASEIIANANGEVSRISYKYEEMKSNIDTFRAKIVSLLKSQLDIANEFKADANISGFKTEPQASEASQASKSEEKPAEESGLSKVEKIVDDINATTTADIPQFIKELEAMTRELPQIDESEYAVSAEGA